jgi:ferritin-like metal-binding protein YciE
MFEHLKTPQEAYEFKLGATLKMERTVLDILDGSIEHAQDEKVRTLLKQHRAETEQHIEVLEQVFGAFEWDIDDSACPAIDGLKAEGKATMKMTDEAIIDSVILQGAAEVEHHEIAVYENLILNAKAMGRMDVVDLLQKNLQSEQGALQKAMTQQEQVAAVTPKHPVA